MSCPVLELMEMLQNVNLELAKFTSATFQGKGQMPWIMSALTRPVYLRPKEDQKERLRNLPWKIKKSHDNIPE